MSASDPGAFGPAGPTLPAGRGCPVAHGGGPGHGGGLPVGVPLTPLYGQAVAEDPHGLYARLRERYGPVAPIELEPGVEAWLVLGYAEMLELTRNEALFSKDSVSYTRV